MISFKEMIQTKPRKMTWFGLVVNSWQLTWSGVVVPKSKVET